MPEDVTTIKQRLGSIRWLLMLYDAITALVISTLLLIIRPGTELNYSAAAVAAHAVGFTLCIIGSRTLVNIYRQIWRYATMGPYILIFIADICGGIIYFCINRACSILGLWMNSYVRFYVAVSMCACNLLAGIGARILYAYMYQHAGQKGRKAAVYRAVLRLAGGVQVQRDSVANGRASSNRIRIAIVGAGRVGVSLAEELLNNPKAVYMPVCFIDTDDNKAGRSLMELPVLKESNATPAVLGSLNVQEIVVCLPNLKSEDRMALYEYYKGTGCKLKVYDTPTVQTVGARRQIREFDIEDLLFRRQVLLDEPATKSYYKDKTVLVTGGGGSIGSELCRQVAAMQPKKLIILDIYENGAYDVQQELKLKYGAGLELQIEICSVTDRPALDLVFETYHPDILIHAAAHKHVPLMEHNVVECIKNNVFGTYTALRCAEEHGCGRFMLVSTDKAVNPTNVMGATKRLCELICLSRSHSDMVVTATRFGNVLGSAGSVIPLFRRQIAVGGPVTVTDKRITRYFMTIPEASGLVLTSGAIGRDGQLFVLDMGMPVKILELAETMIRLSGYTPYTDIQIMEVGLRPGEKLYEELLVDTTTMQKTENDTIFIEQDERLTREDIEQRLARLKVSCDAMDNAAARELLKAIVPTYTEPKKD